MELIDIERTIRMVLNAIPETRTDEAAERLEEAQGKLEEALSLILAAELDEAE